MTTKSCQVNGNNDKSKELKQDEANFAGSYKERKGEITW